MDSNIERWHSKRGICEYLGVRHDTVLAWIKSGIAADKQFNLGVGCLSFIESYKYLEKICGEIFNDDRRLSAYIDEMLKTPNGAFHVRGWNDDLKQLKHYRWIRNQIAHEPSCSEQNMCEPKDALWLDDFYLRIMNQTDPLALYYNATKPRTAPQPSQAYKMPGNYTYDQDNVNYKKTAKRCIGCIIFLMSALLVAMAIIAFLRII